MRHRCAGYKLGRDTEHRKTLRRNLAVALLTHEKIKTTIPKAKSVQPLIERLITTARKGDLAARRRVIKIIGDTYLMSDEDELTRNRYGELTDGPRVIKKLFDQIAPRYVDRPGGYTRIVRLGKHRIGDGAQLCVLQLVGDEQGSQVSGRYSRRRQKADNRTAFAARLRRRPQQEEATETSDTSVEPSTVSPSSDQENAES